MDWMLWWQRLKNIGRGVERSPNPRLPCAPDIHPGIDFAREPDPSWQAALDHMCPPSDVAGRLVLVWDAGDRWQPIHRWTVLQVQPWRYVRPEYRAILMGPHVRTNATLQYIRATVDGLPAMRPRVKGPYVQPFVDRLCYDTFHRLRRQGIWGRPQRFWTIQGSNGGQPYALSAEEQQLWEAEDRTHFAPGDLPYAAFDRRVTDAVERYDLWKYAHHLAEDPGTAAVRAMVNRTRATERDSYRLLWKQWGETAEQLAPEMAFWMRKEGLHRLRHDRPGQKPRHIDLDQIQDRFLNDLDTEAVA